MKRIFQFTIIAIFASLSVNAQTVKVTNTSDTGPGSLRKAITDANNINGINKIEFDIPATDPNYNSTTGVYTIKVTSAQLPDIKNTTLHIDGSTQAANHGNTNTAQLGYAGSVGYISMATLSKIDGPEIEIVDDGGYEVGLKIRSDHVTISDLAIHSFGNAWNNKNANVYFRYADNGKIENCVIGSPAHAIQDPGTNENLGSGLLAVESDNGIITNCLFTQGKAMGGYLKQSSDNWLIEKSQFYQNALQLHWNDGLDVALNTKNCVIRHNIFHENGGNGFDTFTAIGGHKIIGNTMKRNGQLEIEANGIRVYGTNNEFKHNLVFENIGAGFLVTSDAKQITISENSTFDNGKPPLPSNAFGANLDQIGIDLLSSSDNHSRGNKPYVTINDDGDGDLGGNNLQNYSVIESATISGGMLTVKGFAPAGAKVEFFKGAVYSGNSVAQGKTYLFSATEGSASDNDNTTGSYGPGMINGANQGQETNVNRFEFTVSAPTGLATNDLLVSTATVNKNTSEFGGKVTVTGAAASLTPTLQCVYIDASGDFVGKFGYTNTHNTTQNEPIGAQNGFSPAPQNRSQPTSFNTGTFTEVFEATFSSGTLTWNLRGNTVSADASTMRCPADLEVTTVASNNTPTTGDTVTITVTVKNLTVGTPATNVDILNNLDPNFQLISNTPSTGTFNSGSGVWNMNQVVNGTPQTLTLKVKVNGTGTFNASVQSQNQKDPVTANNSASETLTPSGSSGGNNGGIESDGRMATVIAHRNFNRVRSGAHRFYDYIETQPTVATFQKDYRGKAGAIDDFIPAQGPQNTTAIVSTPHDLLGITNAVNVFSADYYKAGNTRLGAILALETRNDVYNHTKVICDRLGGAHLEDMRHVMVKSKPFAMAKLVQGNGEIDYAITFVAYKDNQGNFTIDNKWNQYEYQVPSSSKIYNFQVWSVSESTTKQLVKDIITQLENNGKVSYQNNGKVSYQNNGKAKLPTVYVKTGWYEDGKLALKVQNNAGARQIMVSGVVTEAENLTPKNVTRTVALNSNKTEETVMVDFGYLFDAGFTLTNDNGGGTDQLYFADGPWGVDYAANTGVKQAAFNVFQEKGFTYDPSVWHLEREITFTGDVKNYASIYRLLRPGNETTDISSFNQLRFEASLSGFKTLEVTLISNKIEKWSEQYRTTLKVKGGNLSSYSIDFSDLTSTGNAPLDLSEIDGINFAIIGDYQNFQSAALHLNNLELTNKGATVGLQEELAAAEKVDVFPNPFAESTQVSLQLPERSAVRLQITDITGKLVDVQQLGTVNRGKHTFTYNAAQGMESGVYIMQIEAGNFKATRKIIVTK